MMNKVNNFFSTIGLIVVLLIMVFLCAEGLTRAIFFSSSSPHHYKSFSKEYYKIMCKGQTAPYVIPGQCAFSYDRFPFSEYAPYFGYIPVASYTGHGYHTNAQRFRYNENLSTHKNKNEFRIFITGGSVAWGTDVNQKELYSTILERMLQKRYPKKKIRVISAGVGGYATLQEVMMMRNYIIDYKPDVIIMFTGWNDIYFGYNGVYSYKNPGLRSLTKMLQYAAIKYQTTQQIHLPKSIKDYFQSNRTLPAPPHYDEYKIKLHYLLDRALYKLHYTKKILTKRIVANQTPLNYLVGSILENIRMGYHLAKDHNAKFIVYLQPSLYNTKKKLTAFEKNIETSDEKVHPVLPKYNYQTYNLLRKKLYKFAQKYSFLYVDGDRAIAKSKKTLFADNVHFGDRGNKLIAKDMYKMIINNHIITNNK